MSRGYMFLRAAEPERDGCPVLWLPGVMAGRASARVRPYFRDDLPGHTARNKDEEARYRDAQSAFLARRGDFVWRRANRFRMAGEGYFG